jgi:hypothetical protein
LLEVSRASHRDYQDKTRVAAVAGCEPSRLIPTACKEIFDNALDASPAGGVTYKVGERFLSVKDTGRGMSEELACRIFSTNRASISTKRWRSCGRGMIGNGSRIAMAIVHLSGGSLTVEANGVGFTVTLNGIGIATASGHFESDVQIGTRITARFGPDLEWHDPSVYCHNALLAEGTAWPSRRACAAFFTHDEITALIGDVAATTLLRDFADMFDLSSEATKILKRDFRNKTTGEVAADSVVASQVADIISAGAQPPKQMRRIGRAMLRDHSYGFHESEFRLGDVTLPVAVEVWASGNPVPDREKTGYFRIDAIFLNRAPGLPLGHSHGTIAAHTNIARLVVGNAEIKLLDALKGPCNFDLTLAITAPDLPIVSLGKAIDFRLFADAIESALRQALPKAYVKPAMTLAEAKALRREEEAPLREAEKEVAQRLKLTEERERAARRRERLAKIAEDAGRLHSIYLEETEDVELPKGAFPVLNQKSDPYYFGKKAEMHTNGAWLASAIERLSAGTAWTPTHIRGLHYRMLARGDFVKPDSQIYGHGLDDWSWLQNEVTKPARWLDYIPFSYIYDQRSDPPVIPAPESLAVDGEPRINGVSVFVPSIDLPPPPADVTLNVDTFFPRKRNPYQLVVVGEKSGMKELIAPIAAEFHAISYFPAGEISDTNISEIADHANSDGRELVVLYLSDCDPSGWQMPVSIAHKLRAIRDLHHPDFKFRVIPVALNPEQALSMGLPQSPLKPTEPRAARWRQEFSIEQVEIDALLEMQPHTLVEMLQAVAKEYADPQLHARSEAAAGEWRRQANAAVDAALLRESGTISPQMKAAQDAYNDAVASLARYRESLDDLADAMRKIDVDLTSVGSPPDVPEPILMPAETEVLVSSDMSLAEHIERLFGRKSYGQAQGEGE